MADSEEDSSPSDESDGVNEMEGLDKMNVWDPFKCKEVSTNFFCLSLVDPPNYYRENCKDINDYFHFC